MMVCSVAFCAWGERPAAWWGGGSSCAPAPVMIFLFPAPKEAKGEAKGRRGQQGPGRDGTVFPEDAHLPLFIVFFWGVARKHRAFLKGSWDGALDRPSRRYRGTARCLAPKAVAGCALAGGLAGLAHYPSSR